MLCADFAEMKTQGVQDLADLRGETSAWPDPADLTVGADLLELHGAPAPLQPSATSPRGIGRSP